MENQAERKLAAVLMADVVSFSRLLRENETETLNLVRRFRQDIFLPTLVQKKGRLVKDMGDGYLAIFESAVRAVECAIDIQMSILDHPFLMGTEHLKIRIGIDVGDIILEGNDVFGDGVNVAARLEPLCSPGGVCISDIVHEQIRDKLRIELEPLGMQTLKNINRPVQAWLWPGRSGLGKDTQPRIDDKEVVDKPSIAVLPFENMSVDPEQAFFADGIAEDITAALSRIGQFLVVSRTSAFSFKGQQIDISTIAHKLGVRYVLEGSVRTDLKRIRITARLIEAKEGRNIWAEKYDRSRGEIFDVQDEITQNVVASIQTQIDLAEGSAVRRSDRMQLPIWKLVNLAWREIYELTEESLTNAIGLAKTATEIDPKNGRGFQVLSTGLYHLAMVYSPPNADDLYDEAFLAAEEAIRLAPNLEYAFWARALVLGVRGEIVRAINDFERAIEINPNCSLAYGSMAFALIRDGRYQESINASMNALRSNPCDPSNFFRFSVLGLAEFFLGHFETSEKWCRKALMLKPNDFGSLSLLIALLQHSGRIDEAKLTLEECKKLLPNASVAWAARYNTSREPDASMYLNLLRAAGLA